MGRRRTVTGRVVRRLRRTLAEKRSLTAVVRALAHHLEPGLWWSPAARVAVHARSARLPRHFRSTDAMRASGRRSALARVIRTLVPPVGVWIPPTRAASIAADLVPAAGVPGPPSSAVVVAPTGRSAVLFDTGGEFATRVAIGRPMPARVVAVRSAMQGHLPMPEYSISPDRYVLRENVLDGVPLHRLSIAQRSEAFVSLCGGYTDLVRAERRTARPAAVESAFRAAATRLARDGAWTSLVARRDAAVNQAATWPCVPVHGDLSAENLVVVDGRAHLIDFEFADLMPFFYDVVKLVLDEASCGREDLLLGIRPGGQLREAWQGLWIGAGLSRAPASLEVVFASVVVLYARRLERLRPGGRRRPVLEGTRDVPGLGVVPHV